MEREQRIRRRLNRGIDESSYAEVVPDAYMSQYTDTFAKQQLMICGLGQEELKVDGEWTAGIPQGVIEQRRFVFEDMTSRRVFDNIYSAWSELSQQKVYNPVNKLEVFRRLARNRLGDMLLCKYYLPASYLKDPRAGQPTTLFVPWGVRPRGDFGEPETEVLERLASLKDRMCDTALIKNGKRPYAQVLIMPADIYATEVNSQVSPENAERYFGEVTRQAKAIGFDVKPWSKIREENRDQYESRTSELTPDEIARLLGPNKIQDAFAAAGRRSGLITQEGVASAAFAYLRERIGEAEIVETHYEPIKVSLVAKNKDNGVDRDLPRVYVIPSELQFPWLK